MTQKFYPASSYIKAAMREKNMTPAELSRRTNVPSKTISLLLRNKTGFTIKMDSSLSKVLGYEMGVLSALEANYISNNKREKTYDEIIDVILKYDDANMFRNIIKDILDFSSDKENVEEGSYEDILAIVKKYKQYQNNNDSEEK